MATPGDYAPPLSRQPRVNVSPAPLHPSSPVHSYRRHLPARPPSPSSLIPFPRRAVPSARRPARWALRLLRGRCPSWGRRRRRIPYLFSFFPRPYPPPPFFLLLSVFFLAVAFPTTSSASATGCRRRCHRGRCHLWRLAADARAPQPCARVWWWWWWAPLLVAGLTGRGHGRCARPPPPLGRRGRQPPAATGAVAVAVVAAESAVVGVGWGVAAGAAVRAAVAGPLAVLRVWRRPLGRRRWQLLAASSFFCSFFSRLLPPPGDGTARPIASPSPGQCPRTPHRGDAMGFPDR